MFNECLRGDYNHTPDGVSWKMKEGVMYLQCSKGKKDWLRNINILPAIRNIGGQKMIIPAGFAHAWDTLKPIIEREKPSFFCGYSHGGVLTAYGSAHLEREGYSFGAPGVAVITKKTKWALRHCQFISSERDILLLGQGIYEHGDNRSRLSTATAERRGDTWLEWLSGHSPNLYRQILGAK